MTILSKIWPKTEPKGEWVTWSDGPNSPRSTEFMVYEKPRTKRTTTPISQPYNLIDFFSDALNITTVAGVALAVALHTQEPQQQSSHDSGWPSTITLNR